MNDQTLQQSYEEKNRRDYISAASLGSLVSIPLQLSCAIMDWFMYGRENSALWWLFLKVRIGVAATTAVVWFWFRSSWPCHRRIFGMTWYVGPLFMVLWMIYKASDPISPYYAGLNIILLAMCLISPWTFWQNLVVTVFTLVMYVLVVCISTAEPVNYVMNNTTFLFLTAAFVIIGSWTNSRQRYHEFYLRYELDKNQRELETTNEKLSTQNVALAKANQEIRAAEMQLVQSEKLASLGRFSAGLMHDVLNPLNYAKTGTFTLRKKIRNLPPEQRKEFETILTDVDDGLKRVDDIVSDLRTFTHPGGQAAESTDLGESLNMALRFVSSELKEKNIRVDTRVPEGQRAWISHNHLILVFVNLMENAIDALMEKKFPAGESPAITITAGTNNDKTFLRIHDNGPGIAPEHISKVFDPFYTTKGVGKGTGLGLSICFGILRGYSGDITVASDPGKFCEFTLTLPNYAEKVRTETNGEPVRI